MIRLQDIQGFWRSYLVQVIQPGDTVLDLTAGRGRDTLFLAECVKENGQVFAFDIQTAAIEATRQLLEENKVEARVSLHLLDHARLLEVVDKPVRAAVFNLGYLPGSDRQIITKTDSTLKALQSVLHLLETDGVLVLTLYRAHEGGLTEAESVSTFLASLPKKEYCVLEGKYPNQGEKTPYWIMVQKNRRIDS